jgi:hypothetical protein
METAAKRFRVVIRPHRLASHRHLGRAGEDAIEQRVLVHADFDDRINPEPPSREKLV